VLPCPAVWLVPALPHPGDRAGGAADGAVEKMSLGIRDQDGHDVVLFEGARGVDKPACVPAKDTWQTVGKRERRKINTFRARLPFSPSPERHNYAAGFFVGAAT
jgi:hypothetical protein